MKPAEKEKAGHPRGRPAQAENFGPASDEARLPALPENQNTPAHNRIGRTNGASRQPMRPAAGTAAAAASDSSEWKNRKERTTPNGWFSGLSTKSQSNCRVNLIM